MHEDTDEVYIIGSLRNVHKIASHRVEQKSSEDETD